MARCDIEVSAVFDIETENWDRFVYAGILKVSGEYKDYSWKEQNAFIKDLLAIDGTVWAHNGGRFDALYVLDRYAKKAKEPKANIICAGTRVVIAEIGKTKIADSCALVPLSLSKAAEIAGMEKLETGLACSCDRSCGGYCRINRRMGDNDLSLLRCYLKADCAATLGYISAVRDYASVHDLDLAITVGSSAWQNLQRKCNVTQASWKNKEYLYKRARAGYYGGRVQVFAPSSKQGTRADINSAYPAALKKIEVPYGEPVGYTGHDLTAKAWVDDRPGIYACEVDIPADMFVPPLPSRLLDGRIAYPVGTLRGTWARNELENALTYGCEIKKFDSCVVWPETISLRPWVDLIWQLRYEAGKSTALGKWLKLYANSVTGKFAQRPEKTNMRFGEPENPLGWSLLWPDMCLWSREVAFHAKNAHVQFSAYLTAAARVSLYKQLANAEKSAVYCDTDSCYASLAPSDFIDVGKELGQWDIEGGYKDFLAIAPKFYRFIEPVTGKQTVRSKGIPDLDFEQFDAFLAGETLVQDRGVKQLKSAIASKGGLFQRKRITRSNKQDGIRFGDRILALDGLTYPCDIKWLQLWTTPKGKTELPTLKEPRAYARK